MTKESPMSNKVKEQILKSKNQDMLLVAKQQRSLNTKIAVMLESKYEDLATSNENMEIIENGIITIPAEAKLKLDRNMAVKVNGELYDKIVEMSYKNKVGKGELVTYILWEFYKKHN